MQDPFISLRRSHPKEGENFVKTKAELFQTSETNARCKNRIPVKTKKICATQERKKI
jgi:hypothetical protein